MYYKWIGFIIACLILSAADQAGTIPESISFLGACIMAAGFMSGGKD